jgi:hypothetical protein
VGSPGRFSKIGQEVVALLVENGEDYFAQFRSREKLISDWEQKRSRKELSQKEVLILAVVYAYLGEKERANELLTVEFGNRYKTAFLEYASNVVTPIGLSFQSLAE